MGKCTHRHWVDILRHFFYHSGRTSHKYFMHLLKTLNWTHIDKDPYNVLTSNVVFSYIFSSEMKCNKVSQTMQIHITESSFRDAFYLRSFALPVLTNGIYEFFKSVSVYYSVFLKV